MRAVSPNAETMKVRTVARSGRLRKMRLRTFALESLETRTLMATIPAALVSNQIDISNSGGNQSSPSIALNPLNPQQLAAVWTRLDPNLAPGTTVVVQASTSSNGGATWSTPFNPSAPQIDPTSSATAPVAFAQTTDASVDFDRNGNFYVLVSQHSADNSIGVLLLNKFNLAGNKLIDNFPIYSWTVDQALKPTLALDNNVTSFTDGGGTTQTDTAAGNVYVAWATNDVNAANVTNWNPNSIRVVASSDGGQTFSSERTVNDGGSFGTQRNTSPRLAISQGSAGVAGGQVTIVWDDFGTLATATPTPLDAIKVDKFQSTKVVTFTNPGGFIADAGANNAPITTSFPFTVGALAGNVSDLAVQLNVTHQSLADLSFALVAPDGTTVPLIAKGNVTGTALGFGTGGVNYGLTLSAFAPRALANATAPYIGSFQPAGNLTTFFNKPIQVGTWQLQITDSTTSNVGLLLNASLTFTSGLNTGFDSTVATTTVRGAQGNIYPTASAASPLGIGPSPVLASDNTLGSFSPNQGRLYLAYVNRSTAVDNPTDNTDIYLLTSANGGTTWSGPSIVNNDVATTDGFSEGDRAQFEPAAAVDRSTGTFVISYYDGRYDAARARVATTIASSIDGGATFSPQTFANAALTVSDQATGSTTVLGPIPDNESAGNTAIGNDRATFAFGDHQGLAVLQGHVYPAWSSNVNGGSDGKSLLNIRVATATIAAGPRIISSSMGAIGIDGNGALLDAINTTRAADGTPIASAFDVTFDRPVDPNSFGPADVVVIYHDTLAGSASVSVPVTGVVALNANALGATRFRINFSPQSGVGTYSYEILPAIQDRIRSTSTVVNPVGGITTLASANVPVVIPDLTTVTSTLPVNGFPVGQVVAGLTINFSIAHTYDSDLAITLIAPDGTRVLLVNHRGPAGQNFTNTTFDDSATTPIGQGTAPFTGTFKPDSALARFNGRAINGTWRLEVADTVPIDSGQLNSWTLSIQPGVAVTQQSTGNTMDQNANGTAGQTSDFYAAPTPTGGTAFAAPYKQDTLPLIIPGPHVIGTSISGAIKTVDNLVLNGTVSSFDVTFDRDMDPSTFTAASVLRIQGPAGRINGPFTITANPLGTDPAPASPRTYRITFPTQQLNGTYTITLASDIKSRSGFAIDTNLNAGVAVLKGVSTTAPVAQTSAANDTPIVIPAKGTISSNITVSNDFVIQGLTLTMNVSFPNDPDLTVQLVAPDGTAVTLVSGLGATGTKADFNNTVFDDAATTSISNGGPPYFGRFRPLQPLGALNGSSSIGGPTGAGTGVYQLRVTNGSDTLSGSINSWSLTLLKPTSGTGLGEPVADRPQGTFRIFTMDPTNPIASTTWTSVGPASIGGGRSGRIGGLAVDPSDPSGNTVYVAGASGGVWKTNNFLTTSSAGPTYIPLTDFGPTFGINIGGLAVFGRNNDPNQSIIFAATGEGDTGSTGVGFLRSLDGGASWTLLDSLDNTLPYASRDHAFVGSTSFKIVVDPHPSATGQVVVYAALSGNNGGIWRSTDTGATWGLVDPSTGARQANLAGQATDVVLDPNSGPVDAISNPTGNLQVVFAAIRGVGVFISPNQGQVWNSMTGGVGDPLIQDPSTAIPKPITVNNLGVNPNGPNGRIVLAKPDLFPSSDPDSSLKNLLYEGWLYAAVVTPDNHLGGLYLTKDQGQNWTKLTTPTLPALKGVVRAVPSNDTTLGDYDPLGNATFAQGNYDVSLVVDPTNPNIVYLGGTADGQPSGLIRIDVTAVVDPHSFYLANNLSDGGTLQVNSVGAVALKQNPLLPPDGLFIDPRTNPTINLIRNPNNPLGGGATFYAENTASFANTGANVSWIPFDSVVGGSTDQHRVIAFRDPLTGHARLIFGDDQGVFSGVDLGNGTLSTGIGSQASATGSRNGNLQITQFYYGAAQPSSAAAQIAGALFYGSAQDDGAPHSTANELITGNLSWTGPGGDYTGVATDQTGSGTLYQYAWPCCGGNTTDFFQVNGVGRTNGLIQSSGGTNVPDPQWPFVAGFNFAVNPINGNQIVIGSGAGRLFRTEDQGRFWLVIADPAVLDGSTIPAIAFGAPDPATSNGSLDNFIYAGTNNGHIYVTFTGGGAAGNAWFDITNGDLAGNTASVQKIVTNPTRGSHEAYAVTTNGVYSIADSNPGSGQTWKRITGNLFSLTIDPFGDPSLRQTQLKYLTSLQADWRYILPDDPTKPNGPTHPALYVAGEGGVYRSLDKGASWLQFASTEVNSLVTQPNPPGTGGGIANAHVTDLNMSIGNVDPTTGRAVIAAGDPNLLTASTFGRGTFAIRLAPLVVPNNNPAGAPNNWLTLDPTSLKGLTTGNLEFTTSLTPIIDGTSEQSAFGNRVTVLLYDLTGNPASPVPIPLTGVITTDASGKFRLPAAPGYFTKSGIYTVGVQATDQSGTKGNIALLTFVIDVVPPAPGLILDPVSDSGTYNTDRYTHDNNSTAHPAPLFDVSGIIAPPAGSLTTVVLLRATQVNGVVGPYVVVNTVTTASAGTVQLADINGGKGTIPDTPLLGNAIDTAPPQKNQYLYSAFQTDYLGVQGTNYAPSLPVIVDSRPPTTPTKIQLQGATDSGTSNSDSYTFNNNSPQHAAPVFDISGIEPHATVILQRALDLNGVIGAFTSVATLVDTAGGVVSITDTNGGNGPIPDNPVGSPSNTAPPQGNPYIYKAFQVDLAGNISRDQGFGNTGAVVIDGTDSDDHGDNLGPGGTNEAGWLYMQKVLPLISPNVTNNNRVIVALGADPDPAVTSFGAAAAINSAFLQGPLPALGWSVVYVHTAADMDTFLNGGVAPAYDASNNPVAGGMTLDKTGILYITTANQTVNDIDDTELTVLNQHGPDIASYVLSGGGLFAQAESPGFFGTQVPTWGWLYNIFPGLNETEVGQGGGNGPNNITITPAGAFAFPGLLPSDLSTGPWHNYFDGNLGSLVPAVTDVDDNGVLRNIILTTVGIKLAPIQVIIDSTPPVVSMTTLDPASDTGSSSTDKVTNRNNNPTPGNAPVFNVDNVEPNGIVKLFRAPYNPVSGVIGAAVVVNTFTQVPSVAIGSVQIADTNNGAKIPDGFYVYTTQQTDLAGNVGPMSANLAVQVDATAPVAVKPLTLDPSTDSGTFNNDLTTKDNNGNPYPAPIFDLGSVENHATVQLFRALVVNGIPGASILVNTLNNVAGGISPVPDINNGQGVIADGTYVYTAMQTDLAGNAGPLSNTLTVIINTAVPNPEPPPAPDLEAGSDSGTFNNDNITQYNNGNPYPAPIFDIGTAQQPIDKAATVQLYRAKVVNGVAGAAVLVNTLTNVAGGIIAIADTNAGKGVIADGTYYYTTQLTSLAGISGSMSPALTVIILVNPPAIPSPFRLDAGSDTGTSNSDGITQITLFKHPVFDAGGVIKGSTLNLFRNGVLVNSLLNTAGGTVQISDPTVIVDGTYVYTVQQIDINGNAGPIGGAITVVYDTAQPNTPGKPVLDPKSDTGIKGDNVTSNTAPFLDIPTTIAGLEVNSSLTLVRDGAVVVRSPYNLTGGTVAIQDPGPVPYGTHTYQAYLTDRAGNISALGAKVTIIVANDSPGTITLDPSTDSGVLGDNLTNSSKPTFDVAGVQANSTLRLIRGVLTVASIATGVGGTVKITDPGPLGNGVYVYTTQTIDSGGNISPNGPTLTITVDQNIPLAPTQFKLDPASDSGTLGDNLTNVANPKFDASSIVAGATLSLFRDGTVVGTLVSSLGGTVTITDPGPAAPGTHVYTLTQTSPAGNVSPNAASQTIAIDTAIPAGPPLTLDTASDSGTKGDNITNVTSPFLDAANVVAGATLKLYRNGVNVKTILNAAAGTVLIQDPGPLADGSYTYTAQQTSPAGNISPIGPALVVTINSVAPSTPTTPVLILDPSTDSGVKGDGITAVRRPTISGSADPGVVITLKDNTGKVIGTKTSDSLGNFSFPLSVDLTDGNYSYTALATDSKGTSSAPSTALKLSIVTVLGDYNGDYTTDLAVFRRTGPSQLQWFAKNTPGVTGKSFGAGSLDVPLYGDFDGDGKMDLALYRPSTAQWFVSNSGTSYVNQVLTQFGWAGVDIPMPGNYNGNGIAVVAVYRPTTGQWFVQGKAGSTVVTSGQTGDVPVPADYAGTGTDTFGVYRVSSHTWYVQGQSPVVFPASSTSPADVPVPGTYDATKTSHVAELAVFNTASGLWTIKGPSANRTVQFAPGDIPVPGDYDGTGVTEPAVYRPSTAQWFVQGPNDTAPRLLTPNGFGWADHDIPTISPYKYRSVLATGVGGIGASGKVSGAAFGGLDFGAGAFSLGSSSGGNAGTNSVLSNAPATGDANAATARQRPAQAIEVQMHNTNKNLRAKAPAHAVDHALATLGGAKTRSRFFHLPS